MQTLTEYFRFCILNELIFTSSYYYYWIWMKSQENKYLYQEYFPLTSQLYSTPIIPGRATLFCFSLCWYIFLFLPLTLSSFAPLFPTHSSIHLCIYFCSIFLPPFFHLRPKQKTWVYNSALVKYERWLVKSICVSRFHSVHKVKA
jgi:hypothetical protein